MKKSLTLLATIVIVVVASFGIARAQKSSNKKVVYVSADKANFTQETARGSGSTGVSAVTIWGDPDKGAHATFSKFVPGYDAGMHTHTSDVSIVVIKGAYLYKDDDGEKRVGPGDFLEGPGGHKHWSGGDKTEGALFYEEGPAKFDFIPVK